MANIQTPRPRRYQPPAGTPYSPYLPRSKSGGTPAVSLHQLHSNTSKKSDQTTMKRSKSTTTKTRVGENTFQQATVAISSNKKNNKLNKENCSSRSRERSSAHRPSAWALSPGRKSLPGSPMPDRPSLSPSPSQSSNGSRNMKPSSNGSKNMKPSGGGGGGGVSRVLKYFRQKKVSSNQEKEDYHQFRVLQNRLLQWRFANAQAEASMAAVKIVAEDKLFSVWLQVFKMRNYIVEKKVQMQKLKQEIKFYQIIYPELQLLNEWAKLDRRNYEAVGRIVRKLSAISVSLPLIQDAKVDVVSMYNAMNMAIGFMDDIEALLTIFHPQVERMYYMLTELIIMVKKQKTYLDELRKWTATVASLQARERALQINLIQAGKERSDLQLTVKQNFEKKKKKTWL